MQATQALPRRRGPRGHEHAGPARRMDDLAPSRRSSRRSQGHEHRSSGPRISPHPSPDAASRCSPGGASAADVWIPPAFPPSRRTSLRGVHRMPPLSPPGSVPVGRRSPTTLTARPRRIPTRARGEHVEPAREELDEVSARTSVGPGAPLDARPQSTPGPGCRVQAVEILDLCERREPVRSIPESGSAIAASARVLRSPRASTAAVIRFSSLDTNRTMHRPREAPGRCFASRRPRAHGRRFVLVRSRPGLLRRDRRTSPRCAHRCGRHEEELIAIRHRLLDDRGRERCEEIALDRAIEGSSPELGAEALLDEERIRGIVQLDGPWSPAQSAARESVRELLVEERPHRRARERPEHDHAIQPVQGLRPERRSDDALDSGRCERCVVSGFDPIERLCASGAPRFDVRTMTVRRKSTIRPWRSVVRPSSNTWRKRSQMGSGGLLELVEEDHRERILPDGRIRAPPHGLGWRCYP